MITNDKLIADGFLLEQYADGKFWILRKTLIYSFRLMKSGVTSVYISMVGLTIT